MSAPRCSTRCYHDRGHSGPCADVLATPKLTKAQRDALEALETHGLANPCDQYDSEVLVERGLAAWTYDRQFLQLTDAGRAALKGGAK